MKKLLLILLCLPMIFSCGDTEKVKELEDRISELENKIELETKRTYKPTKREMNPEINAQEQIDNAIIPNLPTNPNSY